MNTNPASDYEVRFKQFMKRLTEVYELRPKQSYIYPIMDGVPFCDLETALMLALMRYDQAVNDNKDD